MSSSDEFVRRAEQHVDNAFTSSEPGAAIIVAKGDQVLYRAGIGLANLEHGLPMTAGMVFRLGSLTKPFTATAILMLAEAGKLALDDPITRFFPDYPVGETPITVAHLLAHTSGIQNYTELMEWWVGHRQDLSVADLIGLFKSRPLTFTPGARWYYSNSEYVLLGAIIEQVSGQPYGQFIEQRIFAPLSMQHSYYEAGGRVIRRQVSGYSRPAGEYVHAEYLSYTQVYAAGALLSTVDDLALWFRQLCAGKLIHRQTLEQAWVPYRLNEGVQTHYGYGWMLGTCQGRRSVEHYGFVPGFYTYMLGLPDDAMFVAVLSNDDSRVTRPGRMAFELAALALGLPYQVPQAIALPAEQLLPLAGQYQPRNGPPLNLLIESSRFFVQTADGQRYEIQPLSAVEFFFPEIPEDRVHLQLSADQRLMVLEWTARQKEPIYAWKNLSESGPR